MDNLKLNSAQQKLFDSCSQQLVARAVGKFGHTVTRSLGTLEDLQQTARIAIIRAAKTHDEKQGPFSAYAWACVKNACLDYLRTLKLLAAPSTDDIIQNDDGPVTRFDQIEDAQAAEEERFGLHDEEDGLLYATRRKELDQLLAKITLSPFERSSFILAREFGLEADDIGYVFNLHIEKISHALDRVKQKIQAAKGKNGTS